MRKSEWGPKLWAFLHALSFAFPKEPTQEEKIAFNSLLEALKILIPCPQCRTHYCSYLGESPAPITCGDDLRSWLVDFHNDVNRRTGKPEVSYSDAEKMYTDSKETTPAPQRAAAAAPSENSCSSEMFIIIAVFLFLFLLCACFVLFFLRN